MIAARRAVLAAACCATVVLAAAGCGSSGSSKPLTKHQYVAKADAICVDGERRIAPYKAQLDRLTSGGDPQQVFAKAPGIIRRATAQTGRLVDRLAALRAPAADAAAVQAWIGDVRAQQRLLEQSASAFAKKDVRRIRSLSAQLGRVDRSADRFARRYGMSACATPAS
ncbi:MAG TPA: hypothetical protein VFT42_01400 [Solirubrobacteraceae bacterium]|nr:hypothetical protein [Solirubrobacteraceae bacterium]